MTLVVKSHAKAPGTHRASVFVMPHTWVPAFAGMTIKGAGKTKEKLSMDVSDEHHTKKPAASLLMEREQDGRVFHGEVSGGRLASLMLIAYQVAVSVPSIRAASSIYSLQPLPQRLPI